MTNNRSALFVVNQAETSLLLHVGEKKGLAKKFLNELTDNNLLSQENQTDLYYYLPMSGYGLLIIKEESKIIDEAALYLIHHGGGWGKLRTVSISASR